MEIGVEKLFSIDQTLSDQWPNYNPELFRIKLTMTDKKHAFIGLIILFVLSCDGPAGFNSAPDERSPYELDILDVITEPDTVIKGDTLYLECYFEDDASESIVFFWEVDGLGKTDTVSPSINFIVTLEPGEYSGLVTADDTLANRVADFETFTFNLSD